MKTEDQSERLKVCTLRADGRSGRIVQPLVTLGNGPRTLHGGRCRRLTASHPVEALNVK